MRVMVNIAALLCVCIVGIAEAGEPIYAVPDSDRARADLAILVLPVTLDLEMVDGMVYPRAKSLFRKGDTNVYVKPGEREVALRYNEFFQTTANDHDIIKSKILVLKFMAEPGKAYRAKHEEFRNAAKARAGTANFVLQILDDQGNNRVISASQVQKNWRGEETTTTRADLVSAAAVAEKPALAATPSAAVAAGSAGSTGSAFVPATTASGATAFELLKFTWQNAQAADREKFLVWLKESQPAQQSAGDSSSTK